MPFAHLFKMCEGRTTKIARLGDNMPDRDTRSERLRVTCQKGRQGFEKRTNMWIIIWEMDIHEMMSIV